MVGVFLSAISYFLTSTPAIIISNMKKRVLLSLVALTATALVLLSVPQTISAAACTSVSDYGAIDMALPVLPVSDTHAIWIRMQSLSPTAGVLVEVNQANCFNITGSNLSPDKWSWQTYQQSGAIVPLSFPNLEGNNIRLIGIESGVKIDRVLITRSDCIPLEFGDNCGDASQAANTLSSSTATIIPPPSNDSVSGKVLLSSTPERYRSLLKSLDYSVDGQTLQSSAKNENFDTTLVNNGKHTIIITTTLTNGAIIKEQTVIDVDNLENAISPTVRWMRLHTGTIKTVAIIFGFLLIFIFLYSTLKGWYIRQRERSFHGF
jgi:hypothetical protein